MKNLRAELQEHRLNAIEGTPKPADPNQKNGKMPPGCVVIAVQMDTLQVIVEEKFGTKK